MDLSPFISVFCEASQKPVSVHNNTQEQDSKRVSVCFNVVQLVWLNAFVCLFVCFCLPFALPPETSFSPWLWIYYCWHLSPLSAIRNGLRSSIKPKGISRCVTSNNWFGCYDILIYNIYAKYKSGIRVSQSWLSFGSDCPSDGRGHPFIKWYFDWALLSFLIHVSLSPWSVVSGQRRISQGG